MAVVAALPAAEEGEVAAVVGSRRFIFPQGMPSTRILFAGGGRRHCRTVAILTGVLKSF